VPSKAPSLKLDDPLLGARLGEYEVLGLLGEGGMGVVYKALQPVIKKRVAIKVLKPTAMGDPTLVNRLVAEAEAVNSIAHRNIIDIFGLGRLPDGRPYIVMELLDGEPLDAYLRNKGKLELADAVALLSAIMGPLAAAHRAGVIHRDLKPSNIFLCRQEDDGTRYLKLLDFGLAKRSASLDGATEQTNRAVIQGTPDYMAPEQVRGQAVSPRTDLYALGVLAYRLFTGELPFVAASPLEVMMLQLNEKPKRVPGLPKELADLIERLLAKSPADRPQSTDEVRDQLRALRAQLGDAPALALSPAESSRAARPLVTPGAFTAQMQMPPTIVTSSMARKQLQPPLLILGALAAAALALAAVLVWRWNDTDRPLAVVEAPQVAPVELAPVVKPEPAVPAPVTPEVKPVEAEGEHPEPVVSPKPKPHPAEAPTAEALTRRVDQLEAQLKKAAGPGEEPDPSAITLLKKYHIQAQMKSTPEQRRALAKNLDAFERAFLKQ